MKQGFQLIKQSALSTTLKRNDRLGILLTHLILGGFFIPKNEQTFEINVHLW